ncbi:MAG TPA: gephyrin-like molybdotransferase Glp [Terriglobales bacterium]|nr:gephyrin-like molybdotransferase Glp [Terriglobales bacterium]
MDSNLPKILGFEDARAVVEDHAAKLRPHDTEQVELLQAVGRVLAEPIYADRDFPPFPRAARDGFAVRAADVARVPAQLNVIGEIKAGAAPNQVPTMVADGEAVAIMTGAPAPAGADAIVMVEYTRREGNRIEILRSIAAGNNIVPQGSEAQRGDLLISAGKRFDEAAIAIAASVGRTRLKVYRRTKVAILATGDEIVGVDEQLGPTQIRNSNTYSLSAQVMQAGAEPVPLPVARDEVAHLRTLIEAGLESDLLLLAGGVSMGEYDLVEQVLAQLGAKFFFTGAQIQPGRPIVFGRVRDKYFFGLPGNPVSTMVTFELFVRPLLEALMGLNAQKLIFLHAKLTKDIRTKTGLMRFLPAILSGEFERAEVELAGWHGSGDIATVARANCYLVVPPDREHIPAGEWVPVLLR